MAKRDSEEAKKGMADIFSSSGVDLVSAVVAGDRERTGREKKDEPQNYDNMTSNNAIKQSDIMTSHKPIKQTSKKASPTTQKPKAAPAPETPEKEPDELPILAKRIEEARKMADSPTMTVTLRIPQQMNEWLDEYVHGAWREKIKKQDLVIEALCLVIARRGKPGEEIIATELMPNKESGK